MKEKLVSTEHKLQNQSQEIEKHLSEAHTDPLTLLANRQAFEQELARWVTDAHRSGHTFSLMMIAVDDFEKFTDAHGHPAGDEALRNLAKLFRRVMRESDMVCRYSSEEFAVILPGVNREDASSVALRACKIIEKSRGHCGARENRRLTASFGIAEWRNPEDGAALVTRADIALFACKKGGGNCVFQHDGNTAFLVAPDKPSPSFLPQKPARRELQANQREHEGKASGPPSPKVEEPLPEPGVMEQEPLWDLCSRTTFCQQIRNRMAEWKRGGKSFSVALLEINHFDQCGEPPHPLTREQVNLLTAKYIAASSRDMDILGQYAPGCFLLLLPQDEIVSALRAVERIREEYAREKMANNNQLSLTLSIGVVQVLKTDDSLSLLKRAEIALDAADRRGGNQTFSHDGKCCAPITAMLEMMSYLN
jgi:diguanylate cyclase (GGDEF)-like protein